MILEGNLREYPLPELLAILASRCQTGRLELDLESGTGNLYLRSGQLVDARVGSLQGLSAVNVLLSSDEASFRLHSLAVPPVPAFSENELSLLTSLIRVDDTSDTHFVTREAFSEMVSVPITEEIPAELAISDPSERIDPPQYLGSDEDGRSADDFAERSIPHRAPSQTAAEFWWQVELARSRTRATVSRMLLTSQQTLTYIHRHNLAVAGVIVLFVVPAIIAITVSLGKDDLRKLEPVAQTAPPTAAMSPVASNPSTAKQFEKPRPPEIKLTPTVERPVPVKPEPDPKPKPATVSTPEQTVAPNVEVAPLSEVAQPKVFTIAVVTQIEDGRVTGAYVNGHRPGLEAYESTAIRLARQRRFAKGRTGTETIVLTVSAK